MSELNVTRNVIPRTDIVKQTARIGAEIRNIKLSADLPEKTIVALRHLLLEHKVIFFRKQDHLDDAEQERFALLFGKPSPYPEGKLPILEIDSVRGDIQADVWHVDWSCMDAYPKISILRGVVIPLVGGDTVWSNTAAAYLELPRPLQRLADELWAVHSFPGAFKKLYTETLARPRIETEHPVVRVHPETGERALVLGSYVERFVGISRSDGQKLFELFESHITAPENTMRWKWKQGDVAIWDNRATMHCATKDFGEERRVVRRATVEGEVPISVDGRHSAARFKFIQGPPENVV
ncbi:TauD/TfdA family dioxygenase [Bradyrhizobium sp. IC3069]|uniref:TauD/TfdA dioxygenase family protein n=1 Tax=unclassified Bradyrhizobium TaxID=2631580 RepID=UPI001CD5E04E|nr:MULTISPECIES: TauD/TfdA family dioxygenase [unclassified Bradyrhizobium]MCA1363375.1 TauD/TfdA family dioxygenase [Bradyrhizobium sp. IC4059]MCA1520913.1 TauD/TfdA family dioxygenase [Bradyrhizobium sp. IC3069]